MPRHRGDIDDLLHRRRSIDQREKKARAMIEAKLAHVGTRHTHAKDGAQTAQPREVKLDEVLLRARCNPLGFVVP